MTEIEKQEIEEMAEVIKKERKCYNSSCRDCEGFLYCQCDDIGEKCNIQQDSEQVATALHNAGYRKESEEEINKIIITSKRKLYDANLESVNLIMGEREKDIKQAWQNGYNKAREEVVKEFAEKLKTELFANCVILQTISNPQKEDMDSAEAFTIIDQLAAEYGVEEVTE